MNKHTSTQCYVNSTSTPPHNVTWTQQARLHTMLREMNKHASTQCCMNWTSTPPHNVTRNEPARLHTMLRELNKHTSTQCYVNWTSPPPHNVMRNEQARLHTCQKIKYFLTTSFTLWLLHTSRLRTWEANSLESCTFTSSHFCLTSRKPVCY